MGKSQLGTEWVLRFLGDEILTGHEKIGDYVFSHPLKLRLIVGFDDPVRLGVPATGGKED